MARYHTGGRSPTADPVKRVYRLVTGPVPMAQCSVPDWRGIKRMEGERPPAVRTRRTCGRYTHGTSRLGQANG